MINDYKIFEAEILKLTKIDLDSYKERQMKRRINSLISKRGFKGYDDYFKALKTDKNIYQEFINYITINVSEFYRNPGQWEVLEKVIIPYLMEKSKTRLKIWSAACSTGQEPYSLAMLLSKFYSLKNVEIIATDIDDQVLKKAKEGKYDVKSVGGIPKNLMMKFMKKENDFYKMTDELKRCIQFKKHNLLRDPYPSGLDLIICRNVLIYFTEEAKEGIYKKFNKSLKKEGVLFVGSTEQIINSVKYNFKPLKTFFYQKNGEL